MGFAMEYFRASNGRKKRRIEQKNKEQTTVVDLSIHSSDGNISGISDTKPDRGGGGNMGGIPSIIVCGVSPDWIMK